MIAPGQSGYTFDFNSITSFVPSQSGVYAIYNQQSWIYVGEGPDIRARLLAHLNGDNPCILNYGATGFQFEPVVADQRVARQDALILQLGPACNKKLG
ncbi:MAG: GIY-YIG nuclease family protein [Terriglobia bacterium]|jgi:excinuclease UvrABC nuclease subunit